MNPVKNQAKKTTDDHIHPIGSRYKQNLSMQHRRCSRHHLPPHLPIRP
ncbi:hypothetical protein [Polaromonas sp. CG9_12]|nr:hypothetical protein [Polaromonas sp. CG9_12]